MNAAGINRRKVVVWSAMASATIKAHAQGPDVPLKVIVPFSAGSTIDAVGRMVADQYQQRTKRVAIVENKSGAGGVVGTLAAANAKPDGNTIVLVANNFSTMPAVRSDLPFDAEKDFAPIALVGYLPYAIVVPTSSPANSLKDLFEMARRTRQPITYGTIGVGSHGHFIGTMIQKATGAPLMQVPFRGNSEIMIGVIGGTVQMGITNLQLSIEQMKDKRVKILATLTEKRNALTPEIPTFSEAGYGRVVENAWYGFLAPSKTPGPEIESLRAEIQKILSSDEIQRKLTALGIVPVNATSGQFGELIHSELEKYTRIAREENIKAE